MNIFQSWQAWAILSAAFAALTAIFAKIGIENVNSDFATFVRTIVILCALGAIWRGSNLSNSLLDWIDGRYSVSLIFSERALA